MTEVGHDPHRTWRHQRWRPLLLVAGPGRPWHQGWADDTHRLEAQHTTDTLSAILSAILRAANQ